MRVTKRLLWKRPTSEDVLHLTSSDQTLEPSPSQHSRDRRPEHPVNSSIQRPRNKVVSEHPPIQPGPHTSNPNTTQSASGIQTRRRIYSRTLATVVSIPCLDDGAGNRVESGSVNVVEDDIEDDIADNIEYNIEDGIKDSIEDGIEDCIEYDFKDGGAEEGDALFNCQCQNTGTLCTSQRPVRTTKRLGASRSRSTSFSASFFQQRGRPRVYSTTRAAKCTRGIQIGLDEQGRRHCDDKSPREPSHYDRRGRTTYLSHRPHAGINDVQICRRCGMAGRELGEGSIDGHKCEGADSSEIDGEDGGE